MAIYACSKKDWLALRQRKKTSHKGENGRLLILAGSGQYHGSLILAVLAAMRFCDLVYVHSTGENMGLVKKIKLATPNVIVVQKNRLPEFFAKADTYLVGPGWEKNNENKRLLIKAIRSKKPVVIDATALYMIKPKMLAQNVVITPHRGEFKDLFGINANAENVKSMAKKHGCTILCKGPADLIASGKRFAINKIHHPGMTCGGSGDVLAGLLGALLAGHNKLFEASCAACYLNGLAGMLLAKKMGVHYAASDIAGKLPYAASEVEKG